MAGFGKGREVGEDYTNSGVVVSGKLYRLPDIDPTLIPSIDFTFADIYASTLEHDHINTVAFALAFRAYFLKPACHLIRPYLQASFGPTYISHRQLGTCIQGENVAFQSTMEAGIEFGCQRQAFDLNIRLIHYCNAGIFDPNDGFDLLPVISLGYLF